MVKNLPAKQEALVQSLGWKIPWRREQQPTPVFLPGKFHGRRSLAGYSLWGHKESDRTEVTNACILIASALEDGGWILTVTPAFPDVSVSAKPVSSCELVLTHLRNLLPLELPSAADV